MTKVDHRIDELDETPEQLVIGSRGTIVGMQMRKRRKDVKNKVQKMMSQAMERSKEAKKRKRKNEG